MWYNLTPKLKPLCIFTIVIDNWFPELCAITLPRIKSWAERIGADFKIISDRKFPEFPLNYERLQIHELGKDYYWNACIDADYVIDPERLENPSQNRDPLKVYSENAMNADYFFAPHPYLLRDGRNDGIADNFVMASWFTHDFWAPLDMSYDQASKYCIRNPRQVSEFCFTLNVARYGLKLDQVIRDRRWLVHLDATTHSEGGKEGVLARAQTAIEQIEQNSKIYHELKD